MDRGEEENDGGSGGRKNREKIEWSCGGVGGSRVWLAAKSKREGEVVRHNTTYHQQTPAQHLTTKSIHLFTHYFASSS